MKKSELRKIIKEEISKVLKENMSLEVDDDFIELSADSGEYDGDLNDDGTVDFSVVYDDGTEVCACACACGIIWKCGRVGAWARASTGGVT